MDEQEHRRTPRVMHAFMVRYRALSDAQGAWGVSPLRDLSSGGARFVCERPFPMEELLELQLVLPSAKAPVSLQARVTWVKPGPLNLAEHGVEFGKVPAETQQLIDTAVAHFARTPRHSVE